MGETEDSGNSTDSDRTSKIVPGPPFIRHYSAHQLVAWQPQGVLDDALLDEIAEWITAIENVSLPFKRFIDFGQVTSIAIRTRHVFEFAQRRARDFKGPHPVRTALYSEDWIGFGVARLYESLMEHTKIEARAFRTRSWAAEWLQVPADVLTLADEPGPLR